MDESTSQQYTSYDQLQRLKLENMRLLSQLIKVKLNAEKRSTIIIFHVIVISAL